MIKLDWKGVDGDLRELMRRYDELPRHISKKHLQAAVKRALKGGVPILKRYTPPIGVGRGRRRKGSKSTGALKRAVTVKSKYIGRNKDGFVWGVLGYKYGWESRKAIWHEFGTSRMQARLMIQHAMRDYKGPAVSQLTKEMALALVSAVREIAGGRNPTRTF